MPFWVFVDALDEYVRSLDPLLFAPLGDEVLAELAQVVPGLPGVAAAPAQAGTHERYRIHRAVTLLLERLAAYRPLVLVLDDLHWADSGSFELADGAAAPAPGGAGARSRWRCARGSCPSRSRPRSSAHCAATR